MKLKHLLLAGVAAGAANMAMAGQTITFQGTIVSSTCVVKVGTTEGDATVTLPTVSTKDLPALGATAGATAFTLNVTGCTAITGYTGIKTRFAAHKVVGKNLGNEETASAAKNVAIQLLEGEITDNKELDFATVGSAGYVVSTNSALLSDATASFPFVARYIAEKDTPVAEPDTVEAGNVKAVVDYELVYN